MNNRLILSITRPPFLTNLPKNRFNEKRNKILHEDLVIKTKCTIFAALETNAAWSTNENKAQTANYSSINVKAYRKDITSNQSIKSNDNI